jgi:peptide/nickel transport system permease protein
MSRRPRIWPPAAVLAALYGAALCAGFLAPYDVAEQDRGLPFAPPTRLHFVDGDGGFHLRPFVYRLDPVPGTFDRYEEDRGRRYPLRFLVRPHPGSTGGGRRLFGVDEPARVFLLGSDGFGRDLFSRLLHGARLSLLSGLLAGLLAVLLGLAAGAVAGYYGGWLDALLMRAAELFLALPALYLLLAVRAFLPLQVSPGQAFVLLIGVIGLAGWPQTARLVRGVVMSARRRDYVEAARGFGASDLYLLRRHVLPPALTAAVTQLTLSVPRYVLAEVTLSFLGLGIGAPTPSLGNLLAALQRYHIVVSYGWMFAPALVLVAVVLSYHRLADVLQRRRISATV